MNRHRSASARALLTFAALATALTAQGTPIGFAETYALAAERSKAVASLVQGTDEWYRYHCRERLDARDFATVRELLGAWERQHGRNRHVTETARRLALLDFAGDPAATYQYLRETLALRFEHRQQVGSEATGLGSALPASAIATATLRQRALQRDPNTVDRFTDAALPELLQTDLRDNQLHSLLTRLRRADLPNLPAAIVRNLGHRQSRGFGSLDVHGLLFLDQLEACAQLRPQLLDEPPFVGQMLRALTPNGDRRWQEDPALRHQQLLRLQAFADRLSPSFNSFKAHVLHHLLQHDLANGTVDEARFVAYLRLPRRAAYSNQLYVDSFDRTALANLGTEYVTGLPPVGDDQALVRDCLEHCFARRDDVGPFGSFLDADYVRHVLAETKLLLGQGAAERWYTLRNDAGAIERLEQRVEIRFPHTRKSTYAADEPVSIDVDCKNVPTLLVKVYAIDAHRYYTEVGREIGADIELDGVVPNHEQTVTSQLPRIRRQRHTFALPQLAGPGVYVIEFVGNGTSSRAVIHKGALHHTVRTTAAGHRFRIHDETGAHRRDATLWLGGRDYATDDQGEILVPFTTDAGSRTAVVRAGARASRVQFDHQSEGYTLDAVAHVERESLVAGQRAKVLLAPRLRCAGALASIRLLDEPVLELVATDRDGVTTRQEVRGLQLGDDQELVHEFVVPERLQRVAFWLRGRVRELDGDTLPMSCQAGTFDVNGVDGGSGRMSPALLRGERGLGSLRVGATLTIGNYLLPLIVSNFLQAHPESRVRLQVHNTATIAGMLRHHEIDLGLVEGQVVDAELEAEPWVEDELVVFCAPGHRLAPRGRVDFAEIADQPWILRERGSGTRATFDAALRQWPGGIVPRLELEHTEAVKRAVESGLGLGCLSRLALRDAFRRGSLVALETPGLDLRRRFSFVWHRGKYHSAAIRQFLADCRAFTAGAQRSDQIPLPPVA